MRSTFKDWLASRTMRLNAFMQALFMSLMAAVATWGQDMWEAFGLTTNQAMIAVALVGIVSGAANMALRVDTHRPLAGRSRGKT